MAVSHQLMAVGQWPVETFLYVKSTGGVPFLKTSPDPTVWESGTEPEGVKRRCLGQLRGSQGHATRWRGRALAGWSAEIRPVKYRVGAAGLSPAIREGLELEEVASVREGGDARDVGRHCTTRLVGWER